MPTKYSNNDHYKKIYMININNIIWIMNTQQKSTNEKKKTRTYVDHNQSYIVWFI